MKKQICIMVLLFLVSLCLLACNRTTSVPVNEESTVRDIQEEREFWKNSDLSSKYTSSDTEMILQVFLNRYDEFYNAKEESEIPSVVYAVFGHLDAIYSENTPEHEIADLGWDAIDELYHGNILAYQQKAENAKLKIQQLYNEVSNGYGWEKAYYVDDFGDSTSDWYIRGKFKGSFSNSATSGSDLIVFVFVDHDLSECNNYDSVRIRLVEYGKYVVKFTNIDYKDVYVKVKIDDVVYQDYPGNMGEKEFYLRRDGELFAPILQAIEEGKEIKFSITESKYTTSKYQFTINSRGLESIPHTWVVD